MTRSAPWERAVSTFLVLQTAVTSAPKAFAIWTAKDPTPPDAPLIKHLLTFLNTSVIAECLQRGNPGHRYRRGLFECQIGRFEDHPFLGGKRDVLGKRSVCAAEDFIAGLKSVTPSPTDSTVPAKSMPSTFGFG